MFRRYTFKTGWTEAIGNRSEFDQIIETRNKPGDLNVSND
jgi:hypothetical protein